MVQFLDSIGIVGATIGIVSVLIGLILVFKLVMRPLAQTSGGSTYLEKKYQRVDLNTYHRLFSLLGLALSLFIVLIIFEFPSVDDDSLVDLGVVQTELEEVIEIPPTEQKLPPPPKVKQPELVVVADEEEIELEIEIDLEVEIDENTVVEEVVAAPEIEEEVEEEVEEIFHVVEESAEPVGGYPKFYEFIRKNLKYPLMARNTNVEGKVYVQFIVGKDGSISNVRTVRGIGAGCDEEAIRVVSKSKKWKPGKQRGRAVKQYLIIPITFKLG